MIALVAYHVDQFKLLEEGGDRREALANLGPGLDGNAQRRRIVENEAHESMSDWPFGKVRYVEIERDQMRQQHVALLVTHREVVPGAVLEIADAGQVHVIAIDRGARHDRDFRSPVAIVRGTDGDPPSHNSEKQHDGQHGHATLAGEPERPDCERREGGRQPNAHAGPRQIRIVDGQGGPSERHGQAQKADDRDQPAERSGEESAERTHCFSGYLKQRTLASVAARQGVKACAMSRRTEWRERYADQTSLVKSVRVDLGSFMSIRDYFEPLASIGMATSAKISCGPFVSKVRS